MLFKSFSLKTLRKAPVLLSFFTSVFLGIFFANYFLRQLTEILVDFDMEKSPSRFRQTGQTDEFVDHVLHTCAPVNV